MKRAKNPNKGLLSPPGGKIDIENAESPVSCAVREANEECGIKSEPKDWKLLGIITEKEYPCIGNIMIFAFEYAKQIDYLPSEITEGVFTFVNPKDFSTSNIPYTDKLYLWNFVLNNKGSVFSIHLDCSGNQIKCTVENE